MWLERCPSRTPFFCVLVSFWFWTHVNKRLYIHMCLLYVQIAISPLWIHQFLFHEGFLVEMVIHVLWRCLFHSCCQMLKVSDVLLLLRFFLLCCVVFVCVFLRSRDDPTKLSTELKLCWSWKVSLYSKPFWCKIRTAFSTLFFVFWETTKMIWAYIAFRFSGFNHVFKG